MPKLDRDKEKSLLAHMENIVTVYESSGRDAVLREWEKISPLVFERETTLSEPLLNVLLELKILMEDPERAEIADLQHAIYQARAALRD